jgi:hypothetical protein
VSALGFRAVEENHDFVSPSTGRLETAFNDMTRQRRLSGAYGTMEPDLWVLEWYGSRLLKRRVISTVPSLDMNQPNNKIP